MPPLSPELIKQIETEAVKRADDPGYSDPYAAGIETGYIAGATAYAHYKEEAERYRKALEGLLSWHTETLVCGLGDKIKAAKAALNPPAGDNTKTEKDGE
jgi:hypothetical protein